MKDKEKKDPRPTAEEFLQFTPIRSDFEWYSDENNLVHIKVPKFTSNIGKKFCSLLRKEQLITADMDVIGSLIWKRCDGKTTVALILKELEKEFPDQKEIDQRLFLFIQQMGQLGYLLY
jgi:coenzyme PQQ synthesis protein D (PqqD)